MEICKKCNETEQKSEIISTEGQQLNVMDSKAQIITETSAAISLDMTSPIMSSVQLTNGGPALTVANQCDSMFFLL